MTNLVENKGIIVEGTVLKNNNNNKGENKMNRKEMRDLAVKRIARGNNMKVSEVMSLINDETVVATADQALNMVQGDLFAETNQYVCRVIEVINDKEIDATKNPEDAGKGCSVNHGIFIQGHFHRNSGLKSHSVKRTVTIVDPKGKTKEVVAGGDAPIKYYDSMVIVDYSKQPNLDPEKTFGFYLYNETVYLIRKDENNKTVLIKNGLEEITEGNEYEAVINCDRHYVPAQSTNGGKKNMKAIAFNSRIYSEAEMTNLVDKAMGGSYRYILDKAIAKRGNEDGTVRVEDIAKADARVTMHNTPSIDIMKFGGNNKGTIMYIDAPLSTVHALLLNDKGINSEDMGIENSDKTTDGEAEATAEVVALNLLKYRNILVDPKDLAGHDFQSRCDVYNAKVFLLIQRASRLRRKAKRVYELAKERGIDVYFQTTKATIEEALNDVAVIFDGDGAKAVNMSTFKTNREVNVVFLAKAKANGVSTSNQMSSGLLSAPIIEEYVGANNIMSDAEDKVREALTEMSRENTEKNIESLASNGFNIKGNSQNPFFAVNPELAVKDRFILNGALSGIADNAIAAVSSGKVPTTGYTLYCAFDNAYSITGGSVRNVLATRPDLHAIEIFNKALLKDKAEKIAEIEDKYDVVEARPYLDVLLLSYGIKYPAVSVFENILVRPLTHRELKYREEQIIKELIESGVKEDSDEVQAVVDAVSFILERGKGTIVLTPEDMIKEVWAGMDTDFDSLAVFTDARLVNILKEHKSNINMMAVGTIIGDRDMKCDMSTELKTPITNNLACSNINLEDIFGSSNSLNL